MTEETLELRVRMDDVEVKDIVYQYLKTCEGQLNLRQCADDLQIAIEDVLKAVAILEGEGKIKVEAEQSPLTETPLAVTETKEPELVKPVTLPEEMWNENPIAPLEAVQPLMAPTTAVAPEPTPQEQTLPPVEPITSTEKNEVTTIEVKEEPPIELTPTIQPEITSKEPPTEVPEPKPTEVPVKETLPIENPAEVSVEAKPAEAPAEEPTIQPLEPSIPPVETSSSIAAEIEPTAPEIKAPEKQPTIQHRPIEPIIITEEQIILKKLEVPKTKPTLEMQQIQQSEIAPTIPPTTAKPITPLPEIPRRAICPKCGLPTDTPLKHWAIKGRIAKRSVLVSLYKCPTCSTMFRSAHTMEIEA